MYPGGNAVNFAVYAKMFGVTRSAYMGYFGNDTEAEHVISSLAAEGIETVKCKQLIGENGCARVTLKVGDRFFLGSNEGGIRGETPFALDRFDLEYIKGFDLVHSGNYCFTERQLPKIHKAGVLLSFDFSDDSTPEYYAQIAPSVDFAFMSCSDIPEDEVKKRLKTVVNYGPCFACASCGAKGCIAYDGKRFYIQQAKPIEKVVDTMGAGDALLASFLVSYGSQIKQGKTDSVVIEACLDQAAGFASKVCSIEGAWGHGFIYEH
jgi:sugar/nucleoside kinase (ribokinase family)